METSIGRSRTAWEPSRNPVASCLADPDYIPDERYQVNAASSGDAAMPGGDDMSGDDGTSGDDGGGAAGDGSGGQGGSAADGGPDSGGGDDDSMADGGSGDPADAGPPKPVLDEVETVGVGVSADRFCAEGSFSVTIQPSDEQGNLFVLDGQDVTCEASVEAGPIDCEVASVSCMAGTESSDAQTALLVILDDSGSMDDNDPDKLRSEACASFVEQIGDRETVAVTDFGHGGTSPAEALRTLQDFTPDVSMAQAACAAVETGPEGTPIYGSMVDAIEVFLPRAREQFGANVNFAVLMLSDGEPDNDTSNRDTALMALRQALVPVYTVGLGPAAEGGDAADANAIGVLQELSEETGGAYASSVDAEGLEGLFDQVARALRTGRCQVSASVTADALTSGQTVSGAVLLDGGAASASYSFMIPVSDVGSSMCMPE